MRNENELNMNFIMEKREKNKFIDHSEQSKWIHSNSTSFSPCFLFSACYDSHFIHWHHASSSSRRVLRYTYPWGEVYVQLNSSMIIIWCGGALRSNAPWIACFAAAFSLLHDATFMGDVDKSLNCYFSLRSTGQVDRKGELTNRDEANNSWNRLIMILTTDSLRQVSEVLWEILLFFLCEAQSALL